jgi:class 3 adenylate cyclase
MDHTSNLTVKNHLIAVYDIENFVQLSKNLTHTELFSMLNDLQIMIIDFLAPLHPIMIKNMGDANLMIFSEDNLDEKLLVVLQLKEKIEAFLHDRGFNHRAAFSMHYGEIAVGLFGKEPFAARDAFGEPINVTFLINGKPFRGRFCITPQLFRQLKSETRKKFHKYTPPISYLAE